MNKYQRGYLPDFFGGLLIVLAVVCVAVGALLAVGVPWLWSVVKPFIHAVTV